ncbi:hypothetical protein Glove_92g17 [Diversispora epigaea]|uniref:Uncharacterized protein n=1 Tax=Diversispora epigaea TaxID=1348612 RepID=A0A397J7M6_9GLOM|nr:hypothetical protein Glove_92g17 [Diversispora epigaea]
MEETRSTNVYVKTRSVNVPRTPSPRPTNKADIIITPQKPILSEKSVQYLHNRIEIKTNDQHAILKTEVSIKIPDAIYDWISKVLSTDKKEFKNAIMAQLESDYEDHHHHFRQVCELILYDFYHMTRLCSFDRNINERTYTVERIVPLFKALQSEYPEYKFSWIEIEVKSIKEMLKVFPGFDLIMNKADGIGIKVSCNQAVVFLEVSGAPNKPDEKHKKVTRRNF